MEKFKVITDKGFTEETVRTISKIKQEPDWMLQSRLMAYKHFNERKMPAWGPDIQLNFDEIHYYGKPNAKKTKNWGEVPAYIKDAFDRLGVPQSERKFLAGLGAQYESEMIYHNLRKELEELGVVFLDMESGIEAYPELAKKWFGRVVHFSDNKFAALNTAAWSGGSFIYVPPGTRVEKPLQTYFRINAKNLGQFERTLIIADKNSYVHYIEGCTAPIYSRNSLHSAVVEIVALEGATVRYTTIQNWSKNVYNLVTKRAFAYENARIEWVDGNLGSKVTMKYPSVFLKGKNAHAEMLSIAFAGKGQVQDVGAKIYHLAAGTTSQVVSKSISKDGGKSTYRGRLFVKKGCDAKSNVSCNSLLLDETSAAETIPFMEINEKASSIGHEAAAGRIGEEQLFYLRTRGFTEQEATGTIVRGFMEPFSKELPMEYAVELNRLIGMNMEGGVG